MTVSGGRQCVLEGQGWPVVENEASDSEAAAHQLVQRWVRGEVSVGSAQAGAVVLAEDRVGDVAAVAVEHSAARGVGLVVYLCHWDGAGWSVDGWSGAEGSSESLAAATQRPASGAPVLDVLRHAGLGGRFVALVARLRSDVVLLGPVGRPSVTAAAHGTVVLLIAEDAELVAGDHAGNQLWTGTTRDLG